MCVMLRTASCLEEADLHCMHLMPVGQAVIQLSLLLLLLWWWWLLLPLRGSNTCAAEGAAEQQQMVESIHAMIGDLELEKQSFLATMHSQQVQCACCTLLSTVKLPHLCCASCWDLA